MRAEGKLQLANCKFQTGRNEPSKNSHFAFCNYQFAICNVRTRHHTGTCSRLSFGLPTAGWVSFGRSVQVVARIALIIACAATPAFAQGQVPAGQQEQTFLYFLFGGGGLIGIACTLPILCMSVAAMALLVEHLITLRREVLMPPGLAEEVHEHISNEEFPHAEQQCKLRPSLLAEVILAGLRHVRFGFAAVEKAMEDALQAQASRILRKIEFLSGIANISTMLGLFGTVVGLVLAFKKVADTQGIARASDLAGGIYLALMTTIEGLAIAIPSVAAYAVLKYRADQLIADAAGLAEFAFAAYKRERSVRRTTSAST